MDRNLISRRQSDALKLEMLRLYFDFREGRPTAESVAEKLRIPVRIVSAWVAFGDFCAFRVSLLGCSNGCRTLKQPLPSHPPDHEVSCDSHL